MVVVVMVVCLWMSMDVFSLLYPFYVTWWQADFCVSMARPEVHDRGKVYGCLPHLHVWHGTW